MRINTRTAVCSLALTVLLALPGVALGQQDAGVIREINDALASNPSLGGTYQLRQGAEGSGVVEIRTEDGVVGRWEFYPEDIVSFSQTRSGQVYLHCDPDLGRCARQTCDAGFANFAGCAEGSGVAATRYSDAVELHYGYDTRVMRALEDAFDRLIAMN